MQNVMPEGINSDENNPIWVTEFDAKAAQEFANALFKRSEQDPTKPIVVFINSPGGEVSGLFTMLAAIDSVPNKILTVAMGYAMSAGAALLAHGAGRFASPYAQIMIHKIQGGAIGGLDEIQNEADYMTRLNDQMFAVLAKDTGKSVADLIETVKVKREVYFNAKEAKEFGIVDAIGIPTILPVPVPQQWQVGLSAVPEEDLDNMITEIAGPKKKLKKGKKAGKKK